MPTNPKRAGKPRGYSARVVSSSQGYKSGRVARRGLHIGAGHIVQDPRVGQGRMPWTGKMKGNVNKAPGGWWMHDSSPRRS